MKTMMPIATNDKEQTSHANMAVSAAAMPAYDIAAKPQIDKADMMKSRMAAAAQRSREFKEMRMLAQAMGAETPPMSRQRLAVPSTMDKPKEQQPAFQPARIENPVRPSPVAQTETEWPPKDMKREEISTGRFLVTPELIGTFWTNELYNEGLVGFTAEKHYYCALPQDYADRLYAEFPARRREFLVKLAEEDREMLEQIGMTMRDINMVRDGVLPENFTVMLKVPYVCGGTNDFDNMLLIQTRPLARRAESILMRQIAYQLPPENVSRAVYVPIYKGRIYLPSNPKGGGGGQSMSAAMKQGNVR